MHLVTLQTVGRGTPWFTALPHLGALGGSGDVMRVTRMEESSRSHDVAMVTAVSTLSPVSTHTWIPAVRSVRMAPGPGLAAPYPWDGGGQCIARAISGMWLLKPVEWTRHVAWGLSPKNQVRIITKYSIVELVFLIDWFSLS